MSVGVVVAPEEEEEFFRVLGVGDAAIECLVDRVEDEEEEEEFLASELFSPLLLG